MSSDSRPRSAPHGGEAAATRPPAKKIFNCIVDDTALVAGVKRSTRNGLRQWVKSNQIRLFVPLYALEQLNLQKAPTTRHSEDVRETLEWLDQATSKYPTAIALQGGDEVFDTWAEVEQFAVPRSLFSETDHDSPPALTDSMTSLSLAGPREEFADTTDQEQAGHGQHDMPIALRPLFNYILWRIHQEIDPAAALQSFVFLCNDPFKAHLAKGFQVRCKRLEQLRDAIGREERDTRNRPPTEHRSSQSVDDSSSPILTKTPPTAPAAMLKPSARVIDPDTFTRAPASPRQSKTASARGTQHGYRSGRSGSTRARGGSISSSTNFVTEHASAPRGRGSPAPVIDAEIDPNSFERPRGGLVGRAGRRLWMPT